MGGRFALPGLVVGTPLPIAEVPRPDRCADVPLDFKDNTI